MISSGGSGLRVGVDLDDLAAAQPDHAVGHLGDGRVVRDQDDRLAQLLLQVDQQPQHALAGVEVERPGRLVAQQQLGVLGQRPGDGHALLLAAGKLRGEMVHPVLQPDQPQGLVDVHRVAADLGDDHHVFAGGEVGHEVVELEDEADRVAAVAGQLGGREGGDLAVAEPDPAGGGRVQPADDVQDRGLARAAGPDHHQQLARVDLQRHVAQGLDRDLSSPKPLRHARQPKQRPAVGVQVHHSWSSIAFRGVLRQEKLCGKSEGLDDRLTFVGRPNTLDAILGHRPQCTRNKGQTVMNESQPQGFPPQDPTTPVITEAALADHAAPNPMAATAMKRLELEQRGQNGTNWFFWVAGLSLVNSAVLLSGGETFFVIGLAITLVVDSITAGIAKGRPTSARCSRYSPWGSTSWWRSSWSVSAGCRESYLAVYAIGMVLYLLDGLLFVLFQDWMSGLPRLWACFACGAASTLSAVGGVGSENLDNSDLAMISGSYAGGSYAPILFSLGFAWICLRSVGPGAAAPRDGRADRPASAERALLPWRGKPTILVTSGEHYGAVLNLDFDYRAVPRRAAAADGLNHTRTFSGAYREIPASFGITDNTLAPKPEPLHLPVGAERPARLLPTAATSSTSRKWDPAYFERLRDFMQPGRTRGVVVEMNLFCPFYDDELWTASPDERGATTSTASATARATEVLHAQASAACWTCSWPSRARSSQS